MQRGAIHHGRFAHAPLMYESFNADVMRRSKRVPNGLSSGRNVAHEAGQHIHLEAPAEVRGLVCNALLTRAVAD